MAYEDVRQSVLDMTLQEIDDVTACGQGDRFASDQQVREYFVVEEIESMLGECEYTQAELDVMASRVIAHKYHYEVETLEI